MSAVLPLAGMFAGIILVGTVAVYLHDMLERRSSQRSSARHGGGSGSLVYRGTTRVSERRSAARGGQVVWVRAGSSVTRSNASEQRTEARPQRAPAARNTVR
jgi:hypothetical protein